MNKLLIAILLLFFLGFGIFVFAETATAVHNILVEEQTELLEDFDSHQSIADRMQNTEYRIQNTDNGILTENRNGNPAESVFKIGKYECTICSKLPKSTIKNII